ncbi:hypothetical protein AAG906_012702 [Vitis piasezkii]
MGIDGGNLVEAKVSGFGIKVGITDAFYSLFSEGEGWRPSISIMNFSCLESAEVSGLEASFLEEEVMGFFKEFFEQSSFVRSLNATFLVLISKKGSAKDLKDFKTISLIRGLYKLFAKVLANRLKRVVGKVVSEFQHAFMEGR